MWIKEKNILLSCVSSSYFTMTHVYSSAVKQLPLGRAKNPIHPICILEFNIWKINYTTETFYKSRVNISVMYIHSTDHHIAKIPPLNVLVVIWGFNAKEIINHLSFCFSDDLTTWEGFRSSTFVAHHGDNSGQWTLYCTALPKALFISSNVGRNSM